MGPLAKIDTIVAGINLDIGRQLYMGPNKAMEFLVPDTSEVTNWRTVVTLRKNFNRIAGQEKTAGDGSQVIFKVADPSNALSSTMILKDLHVKVDGVIYSVATVPPVSSTEALVYTLTCKIRTLRAKFDNTK